MLLLSFTITLATTAIAKESPSVTITPPKPPLTQGFKITNATRPDGATLNLDSQSLFLNGQRWMPVMGEFHYSRYPESEWREELLKMKAGGIDIVSTYIFWIHHEEIEGQFDWSGRRDLRRFVQLCGELDLKVLIRCGPWDHGEVRNGGLPDWILTKGWETRSNDSNYLARVKIFFGEIGRQMNGLLWKNGGPVIGIQLENEYSGPAEHLLTLKQIAQDSGLNVPLYTRTGWPALHSPMTFGELIPLYNVYAEGFWDRELTTMPNIYWAGFHFSPIRTEKDRGADIDGRPLTDESSDAGSYPFLTCEVGGGMMSSYHRRIVVNPLDPLTTTLIKLGSGGVSVGYYMYHGGENPDGKLTTLMESQATGFWNDMPVKNYDFQTAIGQFGQLRPQYHTLRRVHLFLHEWGVPLAAMPAYMPNVRPHGSNDFETLRWAVRSDGHSGYVFANNYQRAHDLPAKPGTQFTINLPPSSSFSSSSSLPSSSSLTFPATPITVPANGCFMWPFNLDLGDGITLAWATAEPVTSIDDENVRTVFFSATKGVTPQFALATSNDSQPVIKKVKPGPSTGLKLTSASGKTLQIIVLDESRSADLWKGKWQGRERVFLTHAGLVFDKGELRLTSANVKDLALSVYPAPDSCSSACNLRHNHDGIFEHFAPSGIDKITLKVSSENIQPAGPPREIPLGKIDLPVAAAPLDADFAKAALWKIHLPASVDLTLDPILRIHYVGDVARVTLNGKLLTDDFYNGNVLELGLKRFAPDILTGNLQVAILPLRQDAPIYLSEKTRPQFHGNSNIAKLDAIELVPRYQLKLTDD